MLRSIAIFLCGLSCLSSLGVAQEFHWFSPLQQNALQGRVHEMRSDSSWGRLPAMLQDSVRGPVWSLGRNAAGIYVEFQSDADTIAVRYQVSGGLNMPHMPTTGVSGVDLYVNDAKDKAWEWAFGKYQFLDTIHYQFNNIGRDGQRTFRLYLPLYNSVKWLEIGVAKNYTLRFKGRSEDDDVKPIMVYGTSIAQGACASRPGMAWTNILGRYFPNEIINLGFSGNGRLEQPILNLMAQEDAAVYILDCVPNLSLTKSRSAAQLDSLIRHAVATIRRKHPSVPIVLAAHSSAFTPGFLNAHTMAEYAASSEVAKKTYDALCASGVKNLHWVGAEAIGFDINSTVDYAHPNDYGMLKIAEAYRQLLKKIL